MANFVTKTYNSISETVMQDISYLTPLSAAVDYVRLFENHQFASTAQPPAAPAAQEITITHQQLYCLYRVNQHNENAHLFSQAPAATMLSELLICIAVVPYEEAHYIDFFGLITNYLYTNHAEIITTYIPPVEKWSAELKAAFMQKLNS